MWETVENGGEGDFVLMLQGMPSIITQTAFSIFIVSTPIRSKCMHPKFGY